MDTNRKNNRYGKSFRKIEVVLFAIAFFAPILTINFGTVKGSFDFGDSKTRIRVYDAEETYNFKTDAKTLSDALIGQGIKINDQDSFSIDKNTKLYGQNLTVEIERSWPITIYDDYKKIKGRASTSDLREAISQNGIEIWPEDKISHDLSFTEVADSSVGRVIRIVRAPKFNLLVDDRKIEIRSWDRTIEEVISGMVTLGPRDQIYPQLTNNAIPGDIIVTRINVVEIEESVLIPFSTTYQNDFNLTAGTNIKAVSGANGSKKRNLKVTYRNGVEVSRVIISERVLSSPTQEVVRRGVMPSSHPNFKKNWWDVMVSAGIKYGISPLELFHVASCESRVNQNSIGHGPGGPFYGMYQYQWGFWQSSFRAAGFSGANWNDGIAQIYSTARYASLNGWNRWWNCRP